MRGQGLGVMGYLLGSRKGMVETGHIGHYGFLIWTCCVHNVCRETRVIHTHAHTGTQRGLKHTLVNIHTTTMAKSQFTGDDQEHTFEYVVRQYARF